MDTYRSIEEIDRDPENWQEAPPDKTMPSLNPLMMARIVSGKTMIDVARAVGVSPLFILRMEQGLYRDPPMGVVDYYTKMLDMPDDWQDRYNHFRLMSRLAAPRPIHGVAESPIAPFTFKRWRLHNWPNVSQIGWCKAFCVHPAGVYSVEKGEQVRVPEEVLIALVEARIYSNEGVRKFAYAIKQTQIMLKNAQMASVHREAA